MPLVGLPGVLTKMMTKIPYTFFRFGHYYFSKRVPSDLREHYSYHRIVQSLRTRNATIADLVLCHCQLNLMSIGQRFALLIVICQESICSSSQCLW